MVEKGCIPLLIDGTFLFSCNTLNLSCPYDIKHRVCVLPCLCINVNQLLRGICLFGYIDGATFSFFLSQLSKLSLLVHMKDYTIQSCICIGLSINYIIILMTLY